MLLVLDPFEFMYARARLKQLIGLEYVEEVVSKRASS